MSFETKAVHRAVLGVITGCFEFLLFFLSPHTMRVICEGIVFVIGQNI